ncbi:MAG: hypothetical protein HY553_19140 [Elusimicrobia bacterium]|nr:hypothetical protein [Elusimicrobiota bacterium]
MRRWAWVLVACLVVPASAAKRRPGRIVDAELGKEFRLKQGESARLPGGRDFLRIEKFINSPCPKGAQCGWSGLAVVYELAVDGKVVRAGPEAKYQVDVKESDYRSYAVFVVDEPERACGRVDPVQRGECLRSLALSRRTPGLCRAISDERTRGFCLEDLAEELKKPELCRDVAAPSQYCLYLRSKAAGDLAACDGIVRFHWRARCFKELSKEGGGGPGSCAALQPELAARCRELVAGPDQ